MTPRRQDPYLSCHFIVNIDGLLAGGFMEVTGLECEIEVEEVTEGGMNEYVHQLFTRAKYPGRIALKHGVTKVDPLWKWFDEVRHGKIRRKKVTVSIPRSGFHPLGEAAIRFKIKGAFPVKWSGPEFNATSDRDVAVEVVELAHHGIELAQHGIELA